MVPLRRAHLALLLPVALLAVLNGCGSGSQSAGRLNSQVANNPANTPGFDLIVDPSPISLLPGLPVIVNITVNPIVGFNDNARLTVSGGNGSFVVGNPIPDSLTLHGSAPMQSSFTVSRGLATPTGRFAGLTVTVTTGVVRRTAVVTVEAQ